MVSAPTVPPFCWLVSSLVICAVSLSVSSFSVPVVGAGGGRGIERESRAGCDGRRIRGRWRSHTGVGGGQQGHGRRPDRETIGRATFLDGPADIRHAHPHVAVSIGHRRESHVDNAVIGGSKCRIGGARCPYDGRPGAATVVAIECPAVVAGVEQFDEDRVVVTGVPAAAGTQCDKIQAEGRTGQPGRDAAVGGGSDIRAGGVGGSGSIAGIEGAEYREVDRQRR